MRPRSQYRMTVLPLARDAIAVAAAAALPRETGGVLIGWRGGGSYQGCTIARAVEVPDAYSDKCSYQREHAAADRAMRQVLDRLSDPELGYVGEWHSHPQHQPPSRQDRASIRGAGRLAGDSVALIVPSLLTRDPPTWAWHALVAQRAAPLPTVVVRRAALHLEDL